MICLNCGRPNPSGTSLCFRCRERRPGLERARGGVIYQRTRETARVKKRGSGILVIGVLLLAALIFAGGTLAVFLAPRDPAPTNQGIAFSSPTSRLDIFEQVTPTPVPTATPWFPSFTPGASPTDLLSFFPPSGEVTLPPSFIFPTPTIPGVITPRPTRRPTATPTRTPTSTPTSNPTPAPPTAKFGANQQGTTKDVQFNDNSTGQVNQWTWDFGPGEGGDTNQNPIHTFASYGEKTVTLTVSGPNGSASITKTVNVNPPPTEPPPTEPPPPSDPPPESLEPANSPA